MRTRTWVMWLGVAALLAACPAARAQNQKPEEAAPLDEEGRVILSWETFKDVTKWEEGRPAEEPGVFTLSWEEVRDLLGIEMKNVQMDKTKLRIPWQEFKALLEWSITKKKEPVAAPPTDWTITAAVYEGQLTKDGAIFDATFHIRILKEKEWKTVPLLPASVAVAEATLPEGAYLRLSGGYYELITAGTGAQEVKVKFSTAVTESAGSNTAGFERVPSGTSIVNLTVPQAGVTVTVANAQSLVKTEGEKETRVTAALPSGAP